MKKYGIIFAMKEEFNAFKELIKISEVKQIYDLTFSKTLIGEVECIMTVCGVGKVHAARTTQIMLDYFHVDAVINVGVAGGVSDKLKIGDIVIGEELVQHDFDIRAFQHDKGYIPGIGVFMKSNEHLVHLVEMVINNNYHKGVIASGDIFCTDKEMSNKIGKRFNALCVEMEGAAIAQVCYLSHVPFLVLRSISDIPNNDNVISYEEFLETSSKKVANVLLEMLKKSI